MSPVHPGAFMPIRRFFSRNLIRWVPFFAAVLAIAGTTPPASAQTSNATNPADILSEAASSTVPAERASARATMLTFLKSINDITRGHPEKIKNAIDCLDLTDVHPTVRQEKGRELALQLKEIIDRTRYVEVEQISDEPLGPPFVFLLQTEGEVRIVRGESGDWRFSRGTVASIQTLYAAVSHRERVTGAIAVPLDSSPALWLRSRLPESLYQTRFLLEDWQWLFLFALILIGILADRILIGVVLTSAHSFLRRRQVDFADEFLRTGLRPLGLFIMAMIWWWGLRFAGLPAAIYAVVLLATKFIAIAAAIWALYRLIDIAGEYLMERALATDGKLDDVLVPLLRKALKVFLVLFGLVFLADNMNLDITGIVAGLGLGGLALALAAQDTVKNLFGSITVLFDRPFLVGDWVKIGSQEGTVTEVGFRSTRLRTFYDSIITVPNGSLINSTVDNMGARRYRRWSTTLGVTYDTPPENVEAFCEGIRELIRRHPHTRKDVFHVYVNEFGPSSLNIMLYVFHNTPDWGTELRERHRLFLDILRLAQQLGVEFAFPTQTLHMFQEPQPEPANYLAPDEQTVRESIASGRQHAEAIASALLGKDDSPGR